MTSLTIQKSIRRIPREVSSTSVDRKERSTSEDRLFVARDLSETQCILRIVEVYVNEEHVLCCGVLFVNLTGKPKLVH